MTRIQPAHNTCTGTGEGWPQQEHTSLGYVCLCTGTLIYISILHHLSCTVRRSTGSGASESLAHIHDYNHVNFGA